MLSGRVVIGCRGSPETLFAGGGDIPGCDIGRGEQGGGAVAGLGCSPRRAEPEGRVGGVEGLSSRRRIAPPHVLAGRIHDVANLLDQNRPVQLERFAQVGLDAKPLRVALMLVSLLRE